MATYQALQRENGLWDMTCTNGAGTFAEGYCGRYGACGGHETALLARVCWDGYRLDHDLMYGVDETARRRCEVCGEWTSGLAYLRGMFPHEWPLCDEHRNREGVSEANHLAHQNGKTRVGGKPWGR